MKSVIILNQFALPRTEGGGTRHVDLFGRLEGWTPLIVAGNRNHYSQRPFITEDRRFRLVRVPPQSGSARHRLIGWAMYAFQAFAVVLTRRHLDIVVGSSPHPFAALAALLGARLRRVPFVLEVRDLWPESIVSAGLLQPDSKLHRLLCGLERYLASHASHVIGVAHGWEAHFSGLGVPDSNYSVISNGAEASDFEVHASREELRRDLGIRGFTAVFAGAHGPKDGVDLILDAAAQCPAINFMLVGDGPAKDTAIARSLREQLDNVEFRGSVAKEDLAKLLRACDVGIHCVAPLAVFNRGMSPNKLYDYLAAGLPVVSNAARALANVVQDGECGRVGGADDLATCLLAVREASGEQRRAWGLAAIQMAQEKFSRRVAAKRLCTMLDTLVSESRSERKALKQ